jgi:hypothetical protein
MKEGREWGPIEIGSIVPLGRGYFPNYSRHFVPGYYRAVPPGQKPSSRFDAQAQVTMFRK